MVWFVRMVAVAIVVGVGWLLFSPPVVALDEGDLSLTCRPLGPESADRRSLLSEGDRDAAVEAYLAETGALDDDDYDAHAQLVQRAEGAAGVLCREARQSRQATLVVVLAGSLGLLVWHRTSPRTPAPRRVAGDPLFNFPFNAGGDAKE